MVPTSRRRTVRVVTPLRTLCVRCAGTRSVSACMPTRRFDGSTVRRFDVATINQAALCCSTSQPSRASATVRGTGLAPLR